MTDTDLTATLTAIEYTYRARLTDLRKRYTARLKHEAWGDPNKAAEIQAEWDADIDAAFQRALDATRDELARAEGQHE